MSFPDHGDPREGVRDADPGGDESQTHHGVGDAEGGPDDGDHPDHKVRVQRDLEGCKRKALYAKSVNSPDLISAHPGYGQKKGGDKQLVVLLKATVWGKEGESVM